MGLTLKKEQFLVDKNGTTKAVVVELAEYNKLLRLISDLQDALDLKHAIETNKGFISHNELIKRLKKQGIV